MALTVLAAAGLTLGGVALATPANAATSDCPNNYLCDFADGGYRGTLYKTTGSVARYSATYDDKTSSIINNKTHSARWFQEPNYAGTSWLQDAGDASEWGGGIYNDSMSSHAY